MNEWIYKGKPFTESPEDAVGFIYIIENIKTGQRYCGKKNFWRSLSKKVPGKTRRKHFKKESDWRKYWSSSDDLAEIFEEFGKEDFKREIIKICYTKGELTYAETEYHFKNDVLTAKLPSGEFAFYNRNIMARWYRKKI